MSGSLIPNGKQQYLDANGSPLAGGKVYYYIPSTTTPKNTYQDINLSILNTNPVVLDAAGECIAWGTGSYRQVVYDVNNNLLPQKSGNNVAYIKYTDIKNYMYLVTKPNSALGQGASSKELAIDAEKLLNDLGFRNGILKLNINFVRSRVGDETKEHRVWIQEISNSRNEIRILPLKTGNQVIDNLNKTNFNNLQNLNKDFKYYREEILNSIHSFNNNFLDSINSFLEAKYGKDFFNTLRKDFGLKNFDDFKKRIYDDFKNAMVDLQSKVKAIMLHGEGQTELVEFVAPEIPVIVTPVA